MKSLRVAPLLLLTLGVLPAFSQKNEVRELVRDVAILQQDVKDMRKAQDENNTANKVMVQQILEMVTKLNTSVAVLESGIRDRLREQEKNVVGPVAGVGVKVDQMTTEFQTLRGSVEDISSRLSKLEQKIVDLGTAMKTMQSPVPPPPGSGGVSSSGVSSESLYANALRDKQSGNLDLALEQLTEYLKEFGSTEAAPNAQYQIGEIYFEKKDYGPAVKAFDLVLEKYGENAKTRDAMLMKGLSLVRLGHRPEAAVVFRDLIDQFPNTEQAAKAKAQLAALNLPAARPRAARKKK
jgi:tol-pal system protein YbgF